MAKKEPEYKRAFVVRRQTSIGIPADLVRRFGIEHAEEAIIKASPDMTHLKIYPTGNIHKKDKTGDNKDDENN